MRKVRWNRIYFHFVYQKIQLLLKRNNRVPTQLSYSVNAVLSAVAVRGDVSRSNRTKARNEKTSVPKEMPYES